MSKKWASKPVLDEATGEPLKTAKGKPVLKKSYSVLQDDFFQYMREAGYEDIERGERGSSEEHLTVTQFKVEREQARLAELQTEKTEVQAEIGQLQVNKAKAEKQLKKRRRNFGYWLPNSRAWRNWRPSILPIQRTCFHSPIEWSPPILPGEKIQTVAGENCQGGALRLPGLPGCLPEIRTVAAQI